MAFTVSEVGGPIGAMTPGMLIISASDSSGTVSAMDLTSEAVENYDIERCAREGYLVLRDSENEDSGQEGSEQQSAEGDMAGVGVGGNNGMPLMALNATKAGMEDLDVETINKIIHEASEGSKFYEHKKKQQKKIDKRIVNMKLQMEKLTPEQIEKAGAQVDKIVREIEANMDLSHYYVHLDMDAFFASVEIRDDPSLRDIPMAVGSESMLSTSNYVARRFGVRAAMPGFIARKLCPQIRIIPCNFKKYQEASNMVQETIKEYDENLYMCMDEAELDITPHVIANSSCIGGQNSQKSSKETIAWAIVEEMRRKIEQATNLTASAGIAPSRFLAKLCSDIKKPNGQCALGNTKEGIKAFLSAIPIRKVNGIGNVTEQMLKAVDIHTCEDLWEKRALLSLLFKRATFQNLLGIAMGTGSTVFKDLSSGTEDAMGGSRKSLSCERTFLGTSDLSFLTKMCKSLSAELETDLQTAGLICKTITLKIKTTEYDVKTRARSIIQRTDSADKIFESAWKIFMSYVGEIPDLTIRLMGIRVSSFEKKDNQHTKTQKTLHQFLMKGRVSAAPAPIPIPAIPAIPAIPVTITYDIMTPSGIVTASIPSYPSVSRPPVPPVLRPPVLQPPALRLPALQPPALQPPAPRTPAPRTQAPRIQAPRSQAPRSPAPRPQASRPPAPRLPPPEQSFVNMICPVCNVTVTAATVQAAERRMDIHIDECLSRTTAREVRAQNQQSDSKSSGVTSSTAPKKRTANGKSATNEAKKVKRATTAGTNKNNGDNNTIPINAFFRKL